MGCKRKRDVWDGIDIGRKDVAGESLVLYS